MSSGRTTVKLSIIKTRVGRDGLPDGSPVCDGVQELGSNLVGRQERPLYDGVMPLGDVSSSRVTDRDSMARSRCDLRESPPSVGI